MLQWGRRANTAESEVNAPSLPVGANKSCGRYQDIARKFCDLAEFFGAYISGNSRDITKKPHKYQHWPCF
jgi:hypothetical protein